MKNVSAIRCALLGLALFSTTAFPQTLTVTQGLALWLRADTGVTSEASGEVTAWADQSPNANNAIQTDPALAPKLVAGALNGKPVIRFDGTDDHLDVAASESLANIGDITSFFVIRMDDFATYRSVWAKTLGNLPASTDFYTLPGSGVPRVFRGDGTLANIGFADGGTALRAGVYLVVGFEMSGTTLTHYLSGQPTASTEITVPLADGGAPLRIGTRDDLFTRMRGDIAELVIYNAALSDTDRNAVVDYLSVKYGIQNLPPSATITSPANGATITAPGSVKLTVDASDPDGTIARVNFFANGQLIGSAITPPFEINISLPTSGTVTFSATALDNKDSSATAADVSVTITGGPSPALASRDGLGLWLDASVGTTAGGGGAVTAWADQSGNGNVAGQLDEGLAPVLVADAAGGKPALRFDGTDDYLEVPTNATIENSGDITSFFVVKFDDFATFRAVWAKTAGPGGNLPAATDFYLVPGSGTPRLYRGNGVDSFGAADGARIGAGRLVVMGFDMAGTLVTHYADGHPSGSTTLPVALADGATALKIGTREDLFTKMKGDIAELLIYNKALNDAERRNLMEYLAGKYGVAMVLPVNNAPTVTINAPAPGANVVVPVDVTITAAAADDDGRIARVEFYANGAPVGVATSEPYTATFNVPTAGDIALTAVATDNLGRQTTSAAVNITARGAAPPPIPLANLQLWLRADDGVTHNASGGVTAWTDFSGNFNNATQSNEAATPQLIAEAINGKPALRFDGANDFLQVAHSASIAITGDITTFFVVRFDDFATFRAVWAKTAGNQPRPTDFYALPNSGIPRVFRGGAGNGFVDGTTGLPAGTYAIVGFDMAGTTLTHYLDGEVNGNGEILVTIADGGTPLTIGTRGDQFTRMKGDIAEIVIYNAALSEENRLKVVGYLREKYFTVTNRPTLSATRSGGNITLSWPTAVSDFNLEANGSIVGGSWDRVTEPVVIAGDQNTVTISIGTGSRFFRLRK